MQKIALSRGGECLSLKYKSAHSKIEWKCKFGHIWSATPDKIMSGRWCPDCSSGLGERMCRLIFEGLFNQKFEKARPSWLVNDRGNQMEFDGYCAKLALAFEHQGTQHVSTKTHFIKTDESLMVRKKDDRAKLRLAKQYGIKLIIVPEIPGTLPLDSARKFIIQSCKRKKIYLPKDAEIKEIDLVRGYYPDTLEELRKLAKERGGLCISDHYLGNNTKLQWQCNVGHMWAAIPRSIKMGTWCPECLGSKKLTIREMNQIAQELGGKCLSKRYLNAHSNLLWECKMGHTWENTPLAVKHSKTWCPICRKRKSGSS
jgi:hypothetical protein